MKPIDYPDVVLTTVIVEIVGMIASRETVQSGQ